VTANQVAPNLWQGSAPGAGPHVGRVADVLVLCACEYQLTQRDFPNVLLIRASLADAEPSEDEVRLAMRTAKQVAGHMAEGRTCLVTCMGGLNRSGLVSGLALRMHGYGGEQAVRAVRVARGPMALSNEHFSRIVRGARVR
jgi:protein-tyrosine phosphatase